MYSLKILGAFIKNENSKQSHDVAIGDQDKYYFHEGKHIYAYNFMGAHKTHENGVDVIRFTTWAPNAKSICVIGDFSH